MSFHSLKCPSWRTNDVVILLINHLLDNLWAHHKASQGLYFSPWATKNQPEVNTVNKKRSRVAYSIVPDHHLLSCTVRYILQTLKFTSEKSWPSRICLLLLYHSSALNLKSLTLKSQVLCCHRRTDFPAKDWHLQKSHFSLPKINKKYLQSDHKSFSYSIHNMPKKEIKKLLPNGELPPNFKSKSL